ncbi:uncharacterized protein B0H18DRAFT_176206 [Fomitopsis serialis]|uniref:uncharacterized protein n=1 Tax=Fomitopsis serialis TaxID=139415 RepID=UPI0020089BF1|nr:uncharacterized protein B0H18DRAFT_176206 [Neoantrodia serialis]KAH9913414.1 hypothetical protein B0H18DRAFT_176206 [Neoantrodia serialis]
MLLFLAVSLSYALPTKYICASSMSLYLQYDTTNRMYIHMTQSTLLRLASCSPSTDRERRLRSCLGSSLSRHPSLRTGDRDLEYGCRLRSLSLSRPSYRSLSLSSRRSYRSRPPYMSLSRSCPPCCSLLFSRLLRLSRPSPSAFRSRSLHEPFSFSPSRSPLAPHCRPAVPPPMLALAPVPILFGGRLLFCGQSFLRCGPPQRKQPAPDPGPTGWPAVPQNDVRPGRVHL